MPLPFQRARPRLALAAAVLLLPLAACQSSQQRAAAMGAEGQQLYESGRYREAAVLLQRAVGLRDDNPDLWLLLGRTRLALRQFSGAYAAYRNALDLDRANREALIAVAQLALNSGNLTDADKYAQQIQALDPNDVGSQLVRGFVAVGEQRYDDANAIADALIAQDKTNAPARVIRSMVYDRQGNTAAALQVLQPVAGSNLPDVLMQLHRLHERTADPRALIGVLIRQIQASPRSLDLQLTLAKQYYLLGRSVDAARRLDLLHRTAPTDELRADTVAMWMDIGVAPQVIAASVRSLPDPAAELTLALAEYLLASGRTAEALTLLAPAVPAKPTMADADRQGALALAQVLAGSVAAGDARAAAVLALDKTQPLALIARSRAALARNDTTTALREARIAQSEYPTLPMAARLLADVYTRQGDAILADRAMDDGQAAMPDSAEFLAANVDRLLAHGDSAGAATVARDFTVRNPGSRQGWLLRRRACTATADSGCLARAGAIIARLGGARLPLPPTPADEMPSDAPRVDL